VESGVDFHPEARLDIDKIAEFIARDGRIDIAHRVVTRILDAIDALVPFPHQSHHRSDLTSRPLRFWREYDYLVAYAPDERPLWVVAVMHGHRSPRVMAAILRGWEHRPE
jgi:plasmid stabilization system protein ParE